MKSVPLTSRGPVDDNNFPWVESQTRSYLSKGEIGFRGLRHEPPPHTSTHRRSRTTGSVATSSMYGDRETVVLPKIATGRSAKSAKTMWKDYENIKIKTVLQNELETPRITPLYVPKNPKPLYKRSVDEWKPFDILHFREFAESGEIEPEDVTNCNEFYSQITFLRNAVRNIDGTTSYQNLCKKPRSWSEPSVVDDQPGLIDGNRLHWQSASSSLPHPRMLLPLKPGPTTQWYAWRAAPPNKNSDKQKSKRKNRIDHHGAFLDAFSPRVAPHPTPAAIKVPESTPKSDNSRLRQVPRGGIPSDPEATSKAGRDKMEDEENSAIIEPKGLTFITESKEESVDQVAQRQTDVNVSQETPKDNVGQELENNEADEQNVVKNEQSGELLKESGEPQATVDGEDGATSTHHEDTDVANQEGEMENGAEESCAGEEQNNSDDSKSDQNPTNEDENDHTPTGEETANDNDVNEGDPGVSQEPDPETDATVEDILVPDTPIDVSENVEPATEDVVQDDETPDDQNNNQELLRDGETPEAPDQPEGTDEVPEDAEEPQPSDGPDDCNQDIETGEKSDQPTDDGDQQCTEP